MLNVLLAAGDFQYLRLREVEYPSTQFDNLSRNRPLFPLMAGGENICGINALFGAVRRQREELTIMGV